MHMDQCYPTPTALMNIGTLAIINANKISNLFTISEPTVRIRRTLMKSLRFTVILLVPDMVMTGANQALISASGTINTCQGLYSRTP